MPDGYCSLHAPPFFVAQTDKGFKGSFFPPGSEAGHSTGLSTPVSQFTSSLRVVQRPPSHLSSHLMGIFETSSSHRWSFLPPFDLTDPNYANITCPKPHYPPPLQHSTTESSVSSYLSAEPSPITQNNDWESMQTYPHFDIPNKYILPSQPMDTAMSPMSQVLFQTWSTCGVGVHSPHLCLAVIPIFIFFHLADTEQNASCSSQTSSSTMLAARMGTPPSMPPNHLCRHYCPTYSQQVLHCWEHLHLPSHLHHQLETVSQPC